MIKKIINKMKNNNERLGKRKWYKKKRFMIPLAFLIIGALGGGNDEGTTTEENPKSEIVVNKKKTVEDIKNDLKQKQEAEEAKKAQEDRENLKVRQDLFKQYMGMLEEMEQPAIDAYTAYQEATQNGSDSYEVYTLAKKAKEEADNTWNKLRKFEVNKTIFGKELSKEIEEMLEDVRIKYMYQSDAMKYAMKYLDTHKPSDLDKVSEALKKVSNYYYSGAIKMVAIMEKLEITE